MNCCQPLCSLWLLSDVCPSPIWRLFCVPVCTPLCNTFVVCYNCASSVVESAQVEGSRSMWISAADKAWRISHSVEFEQKLQLFKRCWRHVSPEHLNKRGNRLKSSSEKVYMPKGLLWWILWLRAGSNVTWMAHKRMQNKDAKTEQLLHVVSSKPAICVLEQ